MYEWAAARDVRRFFVGVSVGGAEHSLAGPFQSKDAACAWIEMQTTIGQAAAIPYERRTYHLERSGSIARSTRFISSDTFVLPLFKASRKSVSALSSSPFFS